HDYWPAELHPYETYASTHVQPHPGAGAGIETQTRVLITSDWQGEPVTMDLWPPPRPSPTATLHWSRDSFQPTADHPRGLGFANGVAPSELSLLPADAPNH